MAKTLDPGHGAGVDAGVRVGAFKDFDAGFRFSTNALRLRSSRAHKPRPFC